MSGEMDEPVQDAGAEGMEGAERDLGGKLGGDHQVEPLAHLARRLVGEGDAEDLLRRDALLDHVGDPAGDDLGLAGARTREHEHRTFDRGGGFLLARIQGC